MEYVYLMQYFHTDNHISTVDVINMHTNMCLANVFYPLCMSPCDPRVSAVSRCGGAVRHSSAVFVPCLTHLSLQSIQAKGYVWIYKSLPQSDPIFIIVFDFKCLPLVDVHDFLVLITDESAS